jgi:hypothetical protein
MGEDDDDPAGAADSNPEEDAEQPDEDGGSAGFDRWRKASAIGGVGTGIARGLQAVFAPPADEIAIVAAVPGEPPDAGERVRVILDLDDPSKSVVIVPGGSSSPGEPSGPKPDG